MSISNFNFVFLGQSVLRYQVPFDVYDTINHIYESKYSELKPANKQLVGKIEKEHSLFYQGEDNDKMTRHNYLPQDVLNWFEQMFHHYLNWNRIKKYNTTLWISLPDKPGQLGNVSSLIGEHKLNISNLVMAGKKPDYINFKFQLIIRDLKNFTNFIAELKQKGIKFKIIRHEDKRNAFTQKILRYFKKN